MEKTIMLIDGNSLMYRAFYAISPVMTDKGTYTNAVYGFLNMLLKATRDYEPSHIAVAFDVHGKTFRNDMYSEYKATRSETPEELRPQFAVIKDVLESMQIKIIEAPGFEADDILGTISHRAKAKGFKSLLVTSDKDILQLVNDDVHVYMNKRGMSDIQIYDEVMVKEKYALTPAQIVDMKGLMGDSSDNIPGVKGVGEKTAVRLLGEYETLEGVYENIDNIKGKLKEKLEKDKEIAILSKKLATIKTDMDIDFEFDNTRAVKLEDTNVIGKLEELKFGNLIKKIRMTTGAHGNSEGGVEEVVQITDDKQLDSLVGELQGMLKVSLYRDKEYIYISEGKKEYKFSLTVDLLGNGFDPDVIINKFSALLKGAESIIVYNLKEWIGFFNKAGIKYEGKIFDTYLAAYVLSHNISRGYDYLIENQLFIDKNSAPAFNMFTLSRKQKQSISSRNLGELYNNVELPLTNILYDMEQCGFTVDVNVLNEIGRKLEGQIEKVQKKIYELAGVKFNINSPKQLGVVLFENLGLQSIKKTKTGHSTDSYVLEKLHDSHEIIPQIIEYRQHTKLRNTYINGMIPIINKTTGKLHTKLHQTGAITGRLSSSEPNLQNIPIRSEQGREIRKAFLPSSKDHVLIGADYSQIELRVLAHISKEHNMIEAFRNNVDIHANTAAQVYNVPLPDVTRKMRSSAKAVNFGIVYGISDFGLSRQLNIPTGKAGEFIKKYLEAFPGIKTYTDSTIEQGKSKGFVETLYHRRIYLSDLKSANYNKRQAAERIAMNAPIQGSAADIIKLAMIAVYNALQKNKLKSKMILQIHDELIIDTYKSEADKVKSILKEEMENIFKLDCPLVVDISEGKNWYETK